MSALRNFSCFVKDARIEESLSSVLKQKMKTEKSVRPIPKDYFYVTHVTNPAKFFWEQKHSTLEKTDSVNRKLILGKKLEKTANYWFRALPNFSLEEGILDGVWVDIPGVRGSIDYRIGDSLVEFKTKDKLPETPEEIIEKYPQDVEQLSFYAILHPELPKENYLVFMTNTKPYKLKAFKVKILDHGRLKTLLLSRISLLRKAIGNDDPTGLGRCRYYDGGCEYNDHKICNCSEQESLSTESLKKSVEVSFDEKFTQQIDQMRKIRPDTKGYFSVHDIIAPRKYYIFAKGLEAENGWKGDSKRDGYLACLSNVIRKLPLTPSPEEMKEAASLLKDKRLKISQKWIKLKSSTKDNGEIVPYIIKVDAAKDKKQIGKPRGYSLAELAIICAAYGKSRGLIFTVYPELDDHIQVHEVTINNSGNVLKYAKSVLDNLEKALKAEDISVVHPCPEFMNDEGKCPLMEKCNSENIRGCAEKAI